MSAEGHEPDPMVVEAVQQVRDRFGVTGLKDMLRLATAELEVAEAAVAELRREVTRDEAPPS